MPMYRNMTEVAPSDCYNLSLSGDVLTNPLSIVLSCLSWNILVLIIDETQIVLPTELTWTETKSEIYNLNFSSRSETIDQVLDSHSDPLQTSDLFVVTCSTECIDELLQKVNVHDNIYNEQGVLTYHHRWLIVTDNQNDFQLMEKQVVNITNLSILLLTNMTGEAVIYSAMWTPVGRRLQVSGLVTNGTVRGEIFPTLKFGLNGRNFIVATLMWGPFVSKHPDLVGNARYRGYCLEILSAVAAVMNFTYIIKEPSDGKWGSVVNGTWTGLIRELAEKGSGMVFAPISIQREREAAIDFSFPYYIEETGVIYKHTTSQLSKAFLFIRPYKWQVWICVIALVPSIGFILWCFGRSSRGIYHRVTLAKGRSLQDSVWVSLGPIFSQGSKMRSEIQVVRMVFIFWMFTCVIYAATYSSNLVALLAVDVERPPFTSLEELSVQKEYKYGVLGASSYVTVFEGSSGLYGRMWGNMVKWHQSGTSALSPNHSSHLTLVDRGGYGYFIDATAARIHMGTSCDLRLFTDNMFPLQYGAGLQNNSAYRREISEIVMKLSQTGLLVKWQRQYWPRYIMCESGSSVNMSIGVTDLSGFFYVALSMLLLATCVLFFEIFISFNY